MNASACENFPENNWIRKYSSEYKNSVEFDTSLIHYAMVAAAGIQLLSKSETEQELTLTELKIGTFTAKLNDVTLVRTNEANGVGEYNLLCSRFKTPLEINHNEPQIVKVCLGRTSQSGGAVEGDLNIVLYSEAKKKPAAAHGQYDEKPHSTSADDCNGR